MNHPPKKKNKDPLFPDENQGDERQLIDLENSENISFEERITLYWNENKAFLFGCILVLMIVVISYQTMRIVKDNMETKIRSEYAAADSNDTLENFVDKYGDKPLSGFAALIIAEEAYTEENYEKALKFYTLATTSPLKNPTLTGRAYIGQAFALYSSGKTSEALAELKAISADNTLSSTTRVEAAYHLAMEAYAGGRDEEFTNYAEQVEDAEFADQWQQRIALINN